jgi:hypothetical protein
MLLFALSAVQPYDTSSPAQLLCGTFSAIAEAHRLHPLASGFATRPSKPFLIASAGNPVLPNRPGNLVPDSDDPVRSLPTPRKDSGRCCMNASVVGGRTIRLVEAVALGHSLRWQNPERRLGESLCPPGPPFRACCIAVPVHRKQRIYSLPCMLQLSC